MRQASNQLPAQIEILHIVNEKATQAPICDVSVLDPLKFSTSHYNIF